MFIVLSAICVVSIKMNAWLLWEACYCVVCVLALNLYFELCFGMGAFGNDCNVVLEGVDVLILYLWLSSMDCICVHMCLMWGFLSLALLYGFCRQLFICCLYFFYEVKVGYYVKHLLWVLYVFSTFRLVEDLMAVLVKGFVCCEVNVMSYINWLVETLIIADGLGFVFRFEVFGVYYLCLLVCLPDVDCCIVCLSGSALVMFGCFAKCLLWDVADNAVCHVMCDGMLTCFCFFVVMVSVLHGVRFAFWRASAVLELDILICSVNVLVNYLRHTNGITLLLLLVFLLDLLVVMLVSLVGAVSTCRNVNFLVFVVLGWCVNYNTGMGVQFTMICLVVAQWFDLLMVYIYFMIVVWISLDICCFAFSRPVATCAFKGSHLLLLLGYKWKRFVIEPGIVEFGQFFVVVLYTLWVGNLRLCEMSCTWKFAGLRLIW
eukprot:gene3286-2268_t